MTDNKTGWQEEGEGDNLIAEAVELAKAEGWTLSGSDVEREAVAPVAVCLFCFDEAEGVDEGDRAKLIAAFGRGTSFPQDCPAHAVEGGAVFPVDAALLQAVANTSRLWQTAAAAPPMRQLDALTAYNTAFDAAYAIFGNSFLNALDTYAPAA